jgi:hypothetical protein
LWSVAYIIPMILASWACKLFPQSSHSGMGGELDIRRELQNSSWSPWIQGLRIEEDIPNAWSTILGIKCTPLIEEALLACGMCTNKSGKAIWSDGFVNEKLNDLVSGIIGTRKKAVLRKFRAILAANE